MRQRLRRRIRRALLALAVVAAPSPAYADVITDARAEAEASRNQAQAEVERNRADVQTGGAEVKTDDVASNNVVLADASNTASGNTVVAPVASGNQVVAPITTGPVSACVVADCSVEDNDTTDNSIRDSFNREECTRGSCNSKETTITNIDSFNRRDTAGTILIGEARKIARAPLPTIDLVGGVSVYGEGKALPSTGIDIGRTLAVGLAFLLVGAVCMWAGRPRPRGAFT